MLTHMDLDEMFGGFEKPKLGEKRDRAASNSSGENDRKRQKRSSSASSASDSDNDELRRIETVERDLVALNEKKVGINSQLKMGYDEKDFTIVRTEKPNCIHEYIAPKGHTPQPFKKPEKPAKEYPFTLDQFQQKAVECIIKNESVLVAAHTSAGKTAVAEYAIA